MKAESALTEQCTAMWKDALISVCRTPSPCLPLHSRLSSPAWDLPCERVCAGSGRADLVPARCLPAWALSTAQVFAIGKSMEQAGWLTQLSSHALFAPQTTMHWPAFPWTPPVSHVCAWPSPSLCGELGCGQQLRGEGSGLGVEVMS